MANEKPNLSYSDFYTFNSNPTATVNPAKVGVVWINNKDKKIFICTNNTLNKNKWEETPNMALLEGKVEDALKELEDMSQEIRTYASGLEYTKQVLATETMYRWDYGVELELAPALHLFRDSPSYYIVGMEMCFYINGTHHPVAHCHLDGLYNTLGADFIVESRTPLKYYIANHYILTHRASFPDPILVLRHYTAGDRYRIDNYYDANYYNFGLTSAIYLSLQDQQDIYNVKRPSNNSYPYYLARGEIISPSRDFPSFNNISVYGLPSSDYYNQGFQSLGPWTIPWYIYYGKETSSTNYMSRLNAVKLDNNLLERFNRMYMGDSYTVKLKAGDSFKIRTRFLLTSKSNPNALYWSDWKRCYLPAGYMAPKPVTYIN